MRCKQAPQFTLVRLVITIGLVASVTVSSRTKCARAEDRGAPVAPREARKAMPAIVPNAPNTSPAVSVRLDLPAIAADPAFDRIVDLNLVRHAWDSLAADSLTDVALELAEGEHILLRPHKAGITADHVLGLAAKLAAEKKDMATLKRLAKAAETRGDKGLAAAISATQSLIGETRAVEPALTVSLDRVDPAAVVRFQSFLKAMQSGRMLGSMENLDALEKQLSQETSLPEPQKRYLATALKEAKRALPKGSDKVADPLKKLLGHTRDFWSQFDPTNPQSDIWHPGNAPQIVNPNDSGLSFKNSSPRLVSVAVQYFMSISGSLSDGTDLGPATNVWTVTGWFNVQPNYTTRIFNSLSNRYYYWYAYTENAEWAGDHNLWVQLPARFRYESDNPQQVNVIRQQGGILKRFNTLYTGDYSAYTVNLR